MLPQCLTTTPVTPAVEEIRLFVLLNLLSVVIALYVAILSWQRRRISGGLPLCLLMIAVAQWSLFSALEIATMTLQGKIFWSKVAYFGTLTAPVLLLYFALDYTGLKKWLTRRNILLVFVFPALTLLLAFTNEHHGLIWNSFTPHPGNPGILQYGHGAFFWIGVFAYSYLCILVSSILLLQNALRMQHAYRRQMIAMLLASILPWGGNIAYLLRIDLFKGIDLTPISFSLAGILAAIAIFRFRLLDLVPVARDVLIENMQDGVIVLDRQNRVLDINPSAQNLIHKSLHQVFGQPILQVMGSQLELVQQTDPSAVFVLQIPWDRAGEVILDINVVPITTAQEKCIGRLISIRDISDQKRIENELQYANARLREQLTEINELQQTLREQAIRDPVTGLYNRRFLNEVLEIELARANREKQPISLVMLDLDRFKVFNDTHGHTAGDRLLKMLGGMLREQTRQGDFACRYGGEEFIIVMPGAPLNAALKRAEHWRQMFSRTTIHYEGKTLQTTFSAGVASFPTHGDTLDTLLKAADDALYAAKRAGRNRVKHACEDCPQQEGLFDRSH